MEIFQRLCGQVFALPETAEGEPLAFFIEAVGPHEKAAGCERGSQGVIAALDEIIFGQLFVAAIVVDDGDGAMFTAVVVIGGLVELGVSKLHFDFAVMMAGYLLGIDHEAVGLLGISGDSGNGDGQFDAELRFHRGGEDGVVAEDFLFFVGEDGMPFDADSGIGIFGEFGTAHNHIAVCVDFIEM